MTPPTKPLSDVRNPWFLTKAIVRIFIAAVTAICIIALIRQIENTTTPTLWTDEDRTELAVAPGTAPITAMPVVLYGDCIDGMGFSMEARFRHVRQYNLYVLDALRYDYVDTVWTRYEDLTLEEIQYVDCSCELEWLNRDE